MRYSFGTYSFDAATLELTREGRRVSIEPQPARALARLLAGAGDLVTRDEMRDAIWGAHTHVDYDRGLAYCIGQVRTALGDSGDNPRFVQTLPRRGFRFVAPVSAAATAPVTANGSPPPGAQPAPAVAPGGPGGHPGEAAADVPTGDVSPADVPQADRRPGGRYAATVSTADLPAANPTVADVPSGAPSRRGLMVAAAVGVVALIGWAVVERGAASATVAVSIFDNETGDPAHDAFVQGLSDVVVTQLTALAPGRVGIVGNAAPLRQPRNIRNLKALASSLDADYIVLGQLQRQNDDLRFIVHFIRLGDGVHLSAQRFIRTPREVSQFEGDVVAEAERAVRAFVLDPASP